MAAIQWRFAEDDPAALDEMQKRLAQIGRAGDVITYTDLARDITFCLPTVNDGKPFQIDVDRWPGHHRTILGEFLGYLAWRSWSQNGFMISALAVSKETQAPSRPFFQWARELGALTDAGELAELEFWSDQLSRAHRFFQLEHGSTTSARGRSLLP
jgi:hypothetical protein